MKMDQTRLYELFSRHESEPKTQCCPGRHTTDYDRRGGMSSVSTFSGWDHAGDGAKMKPVLAKFERY